MARKRPEPPADDEKPVERPDFDRRDTDAADRAWDRIAREDRERDQGGTPPRKGKGS